MKNWIPKNKIVKLAVSAVILSIVLYLIGLFVVLNETKKLENFYKNTETKSSKGEEFLAIKSIAEANQEIIQNLRKFFIQKGDEVKFIEQIEETAKSSNLKFNIASIDVKENQGGSSFKEDVGVKMQIEGSWKDVASFVNKLERLSFGVLVTNMNLDASVPGKWSGSIEFIIFREK
jgi:Tfp pilus assembly protein PilO